MGGPRRGAITGAAAGCGDVGGAAPLRLVAARARQRPGRLLLPGLGIALAAAFVIGVAAEGAIAGDQSARAVLAGLSPLERSVRVTWQGVLTPPVARQAGALLRGLGLDTQTEVLLLNPVRLGGVVVRPAAIAPLDRWLPASIARRLGPCRTELCPMVLAGGGRVPASLAAIGVRIRVADSAPLGSAVPLAFSPVTDAAQPVLVTGDVAGLQALAGLSGVYRTYNWVAELPVALHSWQLSSIETRLLQSQARLSAQGSGFALSAPFSGLAQARAQAGAAPERLLLAGGGAITALVLFIVLAGADLRGDQLAELERLYFAGARTSQAALFVTAESGLLCGYALAAGACLGVLAAALLAGASGDPVAGVLSHSVLTPIGALALVAGWLAATILLAAAVVARGARVIDALAIAACSALAIGLIVNPGGDDALAVLLAPLCCLAAGVVIFRAAAVLLRGGERLARRGPVLARLALVELARAPTLPSLAIAFIAVSIGLGGFALAYRATLLRSVSDQAANQVPLDAIVAPGEDFNTPLQLAPLARWRALAGGAVLPVRRTDANYLSGANTVTVPALGIPASGLALVHGWRTSDGSAPLATLAGRLRAQGPVRSSGPTLPGAARSLSLRAESAALDVSITADLRAPQGMIRRLSLGTAAGRPGWLQARLPRGRWKLEAFELDEPTGLGITNGHQNGENPAPATQAQTRVMLGPMRALGAPGRPLRTFELGDWWAVGAATPVWGQERGSAAVVTFLASGMPGVVRPLQPSDTRPVPVLADPETAAASGPGHGLSLTVDGLPVVAKVVGTLRRFPTLPGDASGFVIADEATLSGALDAQLPGQGRPDELWISTAHLSALRAALRRGPFTQLSPSLRTDVAAQLRSQPVATGVLGTSLAAAAVSAGLSVLGLLTALLGGARDERIERDLEAQGVGPRALRAEVRMRMLIASGLGVSVGLAIAVLLTGLAVETVRAAGASANPQPPVVTVIPWLALALWGIAAIAVLALAAQLATRTARRSAPAGGARAAALSTLSESVTR